MDGISKEELNAFTLAHEKTAIVLEKIATQLEQIALKQDKVINKLENGIADIIIDGISNNYNQTHKDTIEALVRVEKGIEGNRTILTEKLPLVVKEAISTSTIAQDIQHTKWLVGVVGFVIVIVSVILRFLGNATISEENKTLQHLLMQHIESTEGKVAAHVP